MRRAATVLAALLLAGCEGGGEPPEPQAVLVLDAQGVVFRRGEGFERFPFGSPRAEVEQVAGAAYADLPPRRSRNEECGAGPMDVTRYGPIQLNFQEGQLAGWLMSRGAASATGEGIAPGMTRAQLEDQPGVRLIDSTLNGEFEYWTPAGRIGGFLAGGGQVARVESLYAGANCFFR